MGGRTATNVGVRLHPTTQAMSDATDGVHQECKYAVVDVGANSTTVSSVPCILYGIYVDTVLSAHACPIADGAVTVFSLIASLAAGTNLTFPGGIRFETSLVVDPNDAGTGGIVVFYKPL